MTAALYAVQFLGYLGIVGGLGLLVHLGSRP